MIDTPDKLDKWMKVNGVTREGLPPLMINPKTNKPIFCSRTLYRILKYGTDKYETWLAIDHFLGKYK